MKKIIIIGGGIGGLATAALFAKKGFDVSVFEKNTNLGGRANIFKAEGFTFDMGPSWYMMPDIFEDFFALLGEDIKNYLSLERLDPSYRVFTEHPMGSFYDFSADLSKIKDTFELLEPGSGEKLEKYLSHAEHQYIIAKKEFMFKNYDSFFDLFNLRILKEGRKLPLFRSMYSIVSKIFNNELLRKVLQFQTVLLGTSPYQTPGIYSLMNYVDFVQGVWYPKGGIYSLIEALVAICKKNGVAFYTEKTVKKIIVEKGTASGVILSNGEEIRSDYVISNADYEYTERVLLSKDERDHGMSYWESQTLAPSAFIMYLGVNGKVDSLQHHNLLFSTDWKKNFHQIFTTPQWPEHPSIYVSAPSRTDSTVAPFGMENLFVLVPIAAGMKYSDEYAHDYGNFILDRIAQHMNIPNLKARIVYRRDYCIRDFEKDYNSFKGTALGPAHTLMQTAFFRANNISKKIKNLYYVGAYTNPGIGMPICLISAELVYKRIMGINHPAPLSVL